MTIIMIDPGHGGSDPGAQAFGYQEKNFNLQISLKIRDYLQKKYAVKVLMTRTTDQTVSLSERTNMANIQNVDYFCSIHVNAGGGSGFESYIYNGPVPPQTIRYQAIIHDQIINKLKNKYSIKDRGKKRANFHGIKKLCFNIIFFSSLVNFLKKRGWDKTDFPIYPSLFHFVKQTSLHELESQMFSILSIILKEESNRL